MAVTDLTNKKLTFLESVNLENGTWQINFKSNNQNFTNLTIEETVRKDCLTFSSAEPFSLTIASDTQYKGTLEYSTDAATWNTVNKGNAINSVNNTLYLRGSSNDEFNSEMARLGVTGIIQLSGTHIKCKGNIETLLDYQTVLNGEHPSMADFCFVGMFCNCTSLTQAPELPATTLTYHCYGYMFYSCTNLIKAPALPSTILTDHCYSFMFTNCTNLTKAPELPATTLTEGCYSSMFWNCHKLTTAPALPATTLASTCYGGMFADCTSLTQAPELPATVLEGACYEGMFSGCTNLLQAPALPATALTVRCYRWMFKDCTSLTTAPELPATTLAQDCYSSMFQACTNLSTAPKLPATTLVNACYNSMFYGCTSLNTLPALPATTLPGSGYSLGCYQSMFEGCISIKLSTTKTKEYTNEYRIPSGTATGTVETYSLRDMFTNTGGTFTGTPTINTIYYTSNEIIQ